MNKLTRRCECWCQHKKDKLVVKGGGISKLTKKEICVFLLVYFAVKEDVNNNQKVVLSFNNLP